MIGKVIKVNHQKGFVVFEDDIGDYGWFEVLGSAEFEPGEIIIGELHSLGSETIIKQSTKERVDVYIQDHGMSYMAAAEAMLR